MRNLLRNIGKLSMRQKVAAALLFLVVVLTWLAVCLILASYLVG